MGEELLQQRSARDVLAVVRHCGVELSGANLVAALNRIAKHADGRDVVVTGDFDQLLRRLGSQWSPILAGDARSLANLAWSFATLRFADLPWLEALATCAQLRMAQFGHQGLSNTAWSLATLQLLDQPLLKALSTASRVRLGEFERQDLSNTSWALAKLCFRDEPLLAAIAPSARARLNEFGARDLSNISWSFAAFGFGDLPLLAAIAS